MHLYKMSCIILLLINKLRNLLPWKSKSKERTLVQDSVAS
uniref:Uncharacterized protein n=1 Tax=Rhizophora mucronata TaxID=61149 RepID=A0A2P2MY21_RHIMU